MTSVPVDPMAWRRDSFAGCGDYCVALLDRDRTQVADAVGSIERAGGLASPEHLARSDFPFSEDLEDRLARACSEVRAGRGFVVLKGLPVESLTVAGFTAAVWGIGLRFGQALSQNARGELITQVIDATAEDETPRMYRSNLELRPHSDVTAMIALACWQPSMTGGATVLTSAVTVHEEIERRSPRLLEALYRGFHYHRLGEQAAEEEAVTPWRVPVFAWRGGQLSCRYQRAGIAAGHRELGQALTEQELEALDLFDEIARFPDNRLVFYLERGDMLIVNNYTVLHARTGFTNHPKSERARLLVRLWLDAAEFREVPAEFRLFQLNGIPSSEGRACTYDFRKLYAEDPRASGGVPKMDIEASGTGLRPL